MTVGAVPCGTPGDSPTQPSASALCRAIQVLHPRPFAVASRDRAAVGTQGIVTTAGQGGPEPLVEGNRERVVDGWIAGPEPGSGRFVRRR